MATRTVVCLMALAVALPIRAQTQADHHIVSRIRAEAHDRSEILQTVHVLSDIYGPRLTGSPNLKAAGEWAIKRMESWGLTGGRLEPWNFQHPGWTNERLTARIVSPVRDQLIAEVLAWTPSTKGTVRAEAFQMVLPDRPTGDALSAYLHSIGSKVRNRIVLVGQNIPAPVQITRLPTRRDDEQMARRFGPEQEPAPSQNPSGESRLEPPPMTAGEISRRIDEFLVQQGALVRINGSRREHEQIVVFGNATYDINKVVPTVVLRNEDYGRISRILADGVPVELEFEIINTIHPEGATAYNAVAEIEGTDKRQELVMLGGHLDSWHAATGATDNAVGSATMMEVVRIIKALGLKPRRTIRVALWSGEEQGLLGSQAYIEQHFGTFERPKDMFNRLSAYINMDTGTGRLRGATVFGPPEAAALLRETFGPLSDLGIAGAIPTRSRSLGGTDSTSFNHAGLPGINFTQDPIEYETHTHHTNLDTYERIVLDDAKAAATVIAVLAYELAMRDEPLPRFTRSEMPDGSRR